jgi:hypothetical protein
MSLSTNMAINSTATSVQPKALYQTMFQTASSVLKEEVKRLTVAHAVSMKWHALASLDRDSRKANMIRIMAPPLLGG